LKFCNSKRAEDWCQNGAKKNLKFVKLEISIEEIHQFDII